MIKGLKTFCKLFSISLALILTANCSGGGSSSGSYYSGGGGSSGGGGFSGGGGSSGGGGGIVTTLFTMPFTMHGHRATVLASPNDHKILLTGGLSLADNVRDDARIYNSSTGSFPTFSPLTDMQIARKGHTSTLLTIGGGAAPFGSVLIAGGESSSFIHNEVESYDDVSDRFDSQGFMIDDRRNHTATEIDCGGCSIDGYVLITGGRDNFDILDTAELFNPTTGQFIAVGSRLNIERENHTATYMNGPDGKILITGGNTSLDVVDSAEVFNPLTLSFVPAGNRMSVPRQHHRAVLVGNRTATSSDDGVLVVGGIDDFDLALDEGDLFDPIFEDFVKAVDTLVTPVFHHTVTKLPNSFLSDAVVLGGFTDFDSFDLHDSDATSAAEYFRYDFSGNDPDGYFITATGMERTRAMHQASLVDGGSGAIVITGGVSLAGTARDTGEEF